MKWIKKFDEKRGEWAKACFDVGLSHQKLKTLINEN
jgi:hypothetical protein